ncbi:hypothetical protein OUZ56_014018 [Daphnia magna]|uniref:Uncharacterized protein n=1 Tax=Daphnia magna TaxID=35525 RepID=A0ABQ9Z7M5_9CRUS|nr:hypothetical protein OUZ56_014018 [Daphnia magna]
MEYLKPVILQVLSPQCYDEFFLNFNFFHVECLKAALSKGLGLGIIAGSVLVKVPQILKLFNAKSGEGINLTAIFMELFAISANMAYSFRNEFPFSEVKEEIKKKKYVILSSAINELAPLQWLRSAPP